MSFDRIVDILSHAAKRFPGFAERVAEAEAFRRWEKVVGPIVGKHARAFCVKRSVLWVEVDHPVWKTELIHSKRQILDKLNEPGKPVVIEDLFFVDPS